MCCEGQRRYLGCWAVADARKAERNIGKGLTNLLDVLIMLFLNFLVCLVQSLLMRGSHRFNLFRVRLGAFSKGAVVRGECLGIFLFLACQQLRSDGVWKMGRAGARPLLEGVKRSLMYRPDQRGLHAQ